MLNASGGIHANFSEVPSSTKTIDTQIIAYNGRMSNNDAVSMARSIDLRV